MTGVVLGHIYNYGLLNAYFNTRATPSCKKNRAAFFFNNEQDKIGYIGTKASSTIPIF